METFFYRCPICGNILFKVLDSGVTPVCCGQEMEKLEAGTTDGKVEYHVPTVKCCKEGTVTVQIGEQPHPMTEQHSILFVCLETEHGGQIQYLKPGSEPTVKFHTCDKPVAVYAYCNKHGLWKLDLKSCPQKA